MSLSFEEYRRWILDQRIYLSDYITNSLHEKGFECETLIVNDPLFIEKLGSFLKGRKVKAATSVNLKERVKSLADISPLKLYRSLKPSEQVKRNRVVQKACDFFEPDIIFVREPSGIDTYFWNRFRHRSLIVGLIGCNTSHPTNWLSHNFDVLYTLTKEYQLFFQAQGIPSYMFSYGVDKRVYKQLSEITDKKYDVSFVGLLGSHVQTAKTKMMEAIAEKFAFNWWGPRNVDEERFPNLYNTYRGRTSGIEMLTIYRQSKIVVNDYVDTANGIAVNLRLYEVLNTGSLLLTRKAANLEQQFPGDLLAMYHSQEDCLEKIAWYLSHETEREHKAMLATEYALQYFTYNTQLKEMADTLQHHYQTKFNNKKHAAIG